MKKLIIPALFFTLSFSAIANVEIPQIAVPVELAGGEFAEGTLTQLTDAEFAEFLPWAQNAQNQLNRAIKQTQSLPLRERLTHIERAARSVVSRSEGRQYQMFMRFALNRGLLLVDELEKNVDMEEIGSQESALDIIQRSIQIGLSFYESDLNFQRRAQAGDTATKLSYASFGASFMQGMYPGVINVLDATAQYRLLYKLVEMVNWDLSRDAEAARYAEHIVEAHEMLQDLPELPLNDDRSNLRLIRRLNSLKLIEVKNQSNNTVVVTPPTINQDTEVIVASSRSGYASFSYGTSARYCYKVDSQGNRLGDANSTVSMDFCSVGYNSFAYGASARYCYKVDRQGNRLGDANSTVSMDYCSAGFASFAYGTSARYCYKVDGRENRLGDANSTVTMSNCTAGVASFPYGTSARYCYNVDKDGNRLGDANSTIDINQCTAGYATFPYGTSARYCYKVDARGNRLGDANSTISLDYCH